MPVKIIQSTPSAYAYPLLIKQLLHTPLATAPDQEITYQGKLRYSYRTLNERIARLANALAGLGVEAGRLQLPGRDDAVDLVRHPTYSITGAVSSAATALRTGPMR